MKIDKVYAGVIAAIVLASIIGVVGFVNHFTEDDLDDANTGEVNFEVPGDDEGTSSFGSLAEEYNNEIQNERDKDQRSRPIGFDEYSLDDETTIDSTKEEKKVVLDDKKENIKPRTYSYSKKATSTKAKKEKTQSEIDPFARDGFSSANEHENVVDQKNALNTKEVKAITNGEQHVKRGSLMKFRLMEDVFIDGVKKPEGSILYGNVNEISQNRVSITLTSPGFTLAKIHDRKGGEGIIIEGGINQEIVNDGATQGTGQVRINTIIGEIGLGGGKKKLADNAIPIPDHYDVIIKL